MVADVSSVMVRRLFLACWEVDLAASRAFEVVPDMFGEVVGGVEGVAADAGGGLARPRKS